MKKIIILITIFNVVSLVKAQTIVPKIQNGVITQWDFDTLKANAADVDTAKATIRQEAVDNYNYGNAQLAAEVARATAAEAGKLNRAELSLQSVLEAGNVSNLEGVFLRVIARGAGNFIKNTAVGDSSLMQNTTGTSNTAVGWSALKSNTTGINNTSVGSQNLVQNTTGTSNTAVGYNALFSNTAGVNNTAVGRNALNGNTTGYINTAVGFSALSTNSTGNINTAVGQEALRFNTIGSENTAVGYYAQRSNTTGTSNTAVGRAALGNNTTGINNVAIGYDAGAYITRGNNNVAIGYSANVPDSAGNSQISIQNRIIGYENGRIEVKNLLQPDSIKIISDAGFGKILTSDSEGKAVWKQPCKGGATELVPIAANSSVTISAAHPHNSANISATATLHTSVAQPQFIFVSSKTAAVVNFAVINAGNTAANISVNYSICPAN